MPRVYVGNLSSSVTSRDLRELFSRAGEVRGALAINDRASGLCRGFGFVEMAEADDAAVAISLLNHTELNGQPIRIEPAPRRDGAQAPARDRAKRRGSRS